MTQTGSQFTFGATTVDVATLPSVSVDALVRRGLSHFFGNEVASKVTSAKAKYVEDKESNPNGDAPSDEQVSAWKEHFIAEGAAKLTAGTVGIHVPKGPSVDPLEAEISRLAIASVKATLKGAGLKAPKDDEVVKFPNGTTRTMQQMVDKRTADQLDALTKEAKKNLADKAKRAKAAQAAIEAAKASGTNEDPDALGL